LLVICERVRDIKAIAEYILAITKEAFAITSECICDIKAITKEVFAITSKCICDIKAITKPAFAITSEWICDIKTSTKQTLFVIISFKWIGNVCEGITK
jgi:hypothetical protein